MDFPRNQSFIYNFTSINAMNESAHDCTLILPVLSCDDCDYYEVECIGFCMNIETLNISAIPQDDDEKMSFRRADFKKMGLYADNLAEGSDHFLLCCMYSDGSGALPPCKNKNNRFKVDNSCSPKKIRFRLYDINGEPFKENMVNHNDFTHWTVSLEFTPRYE